MSEQDSVVEDTGPSLVNGSRQDPQLAADPASTFKVERYKFILGEIHFLNQNLHKYLTLFQSLATVLLGAGVAVFVSYKKLGITPDIAKSAMFGLLIVLWMLGLYVVISIVAGVLSWMDYRNEEVDLLDEIVGQSFRSRPQAKNLWRWYETYLVLFVILFLALTTFYVVTVVLPLID